MLKNIIRLFLAIPFPILLFQRVQCFFGLRAQESRCYDFLEDWTFSKHPDKKNYVGQIEKKCGNQPDFCYWLCWKIIQRLRNTRVRCCKTAWLCNVGFVCVGNAKYRQSIFYVAYIRLKKSCHCAIEIVLTFSRASSYPFFCVLHNTKETEKTFYSSRRRCLGEPRMFFASCLVSSRLEMLSAT